MMTDRDYMRIAVHLASKARGKTSPNPLVGSVIVRGKTIVAEGFHHRAGGKHAEVIALEKTKGSLKKARMYVTLEPCAHHGRTPPCVDRIIESGIKKVTIGMKDPNPLTNGKSITKLRRSGIKTRVGVEQAACAAINEPFIKRATTNIPYVVAKCAQTIDGKTAAAGGQSKWITSKAARQYARALRDDFDAILVGINTVVNDDPKLNGAGRTKSIIKIVLDSKLRISPRARLFKGAAASRCLIATTDRAPLKKRKLFTDKGVGVIICPRKDGGVNLKWLFRELAKREITSVLIEGGARTVGAALKSDLVDQMHVYIAPRIMGDRGALGSIEGLTTRHVDKSIQLRDMSVRTIGKDFLVTGYVHRYC